MQDHVLFLLLGIAAGAVIAGFALGLVAAFQGSGVVNVAHGAMAMFVTYEYVEMRNAGRVFLPPLPNPLIVVEGVAKIFGGDVHVPAIPTFINLGEPLGFWIAFPVAIAIAATLGFTVHALVFRVLRFAPVLAKIVASVGIMLYLQASTIVRFTTDPIRADKLLPSKPVKILGADVPQDRLWLLVFVVVIAACLQALFRFTKWGLATRAGAEDEVAVTCRGRSPQRNFRIARHLCRHRQRRRRPGQHFFLLRPLVGG